MLVTNNFKHFTKGERHIKKFKTVCLASLISLLGITAIFSTIKPTSGNASTPTTQEESTPLNDHNRIILMVIINNNHFNVDIVSLVVPKIEYILFLEIESQI